MSERERLSPCCPDAQRRGPSRPAPLRASVAYGLAALTGVVYFLGFPGVNALAARLRRPGAADHRLARPAPQARRGARLGHGHADERPRLLLADGMLRSSAASRRRSARSSRCSICAQQGGRGALCRLSSTRAPSSAAGPPRRIFVLAFIASELAYPVLFPWYFGASVHNAPVFLQVADLGGALPRRRRPPRLERRARRARARPPRAAPARIASRSPSPSPRLSLARHLRRAPAPPHRRPRRRRPLASSSASLRATSPCSARPRPSRRTSASPAPCASRAPSWSSGARPRCP
jgi:hypothetical protein